MRILFVSDEVAPFSSSSAAATLSRYLPEQLQESGDFDVRIMMPRYGTISERKNRLHEVIRLSGTDIVMGDSKETLKVKVASIPGIRLQVYFMDNNTYFKRKGVYRDKQGNLFSDNPARALYFGRAVLETIRNLGWGPDAVHAFGWMSAFVPMLLRTEFAGEPLYEDVRTIYTPTPIDFEAPLTAGRLGNLGLDEDPMLLDRELPAVGLAYADAALYPSTMDAPAGAAQLSGNQETLAEEARALYEDVFNEVPA